MVNRLLLRVVLLSGVLGAVASFSSPSSGYIANVGGASRGTSWGDGGFGYMPAAFLQQFGASFIAP
jgi:hypothetical protein